MALLAVAAPVPAAEQRFAFSVNDLDASLASYRVDPQTGHLRFLRYYPLGKSTPTVVVDPSGRFVLATSQSVDRVYVFRLDRLSGTLHPVSGSPFVTGGRAPFQILFHPSGRYLYMAHRFAGVGAYAFDPETGAVSALAGSPYPAGQRTRSIVLHPNGRLLYALNAYSNDLSAYAVEPRTGALKALPGFPVRVGEMGQIDYLAQQMQDVPDSAGGLPYHLTADPAGRFLFITNAASANISVFRVDAGSGAVVEVPGSPFFTGFNPYSATVDPAGKRLYVTRPRDNLVAVHRLDGATGRLTPVAGSPFTSGGEQPAFVTFSRDGRRAYVNNMASNDIAQMAVDPASGTLSVEEVVKTRSAPWFFTLADGDTPPPPRPPRVYAARAARSSAAGELALLTPALETLARATSGGQPSAVVVNPVNAFAYTTNADTGSVTTYRVDEKRPALAAIAQTPAGAEPLAAATDVNGWYLYVANHGDDSLSVYYLDPEEAGKPKPVRGSPVTTGKAPVAVRLDPASRYAFVVNQGSDNVSVYRYRTNVTPLYFESVRYGSPFATGHEPSDLVVDPTGRYAYVANAGDDSLSAYRIHHQTGALSALPGSPFATGRRPVALAAHPSGDFLYVANAGSRGLQRYRIEKALGAVARDGAPLALPVVPKALRMDADGGHLSVLAADGRRVLTYAVAADGTLRLQTDGRPERPLSDFVFVSRP